MLTQIDDSDTLEGVGRAYNPAAVVNKGICIMPVANSSLTGYSTESNRGHALEQPFWVRLTTEPPFILEF
jgi:hypothetical protein